MVYIGILYRGQLFYTYCNIIIASVETGYDETIDKQGADKLLAAWKR